MFYSPQEIPSLRRLLDDVFDLLLVVELVEVVLDQGRLNEIRSEADHANAVTLEVEVVLETIGVGGQGNSLVLKLTVHFCY